MRKLRLSLNCLLKVTEQMRDGAGIKIGAQAFPLYPSVIRCRQLFGPWDLEQTSDAGLQKLKASSSTTWQEKGEDRKSTRLNSSH